MKNSLSSTVELVILVTPHFNIATTTAFLDPFRATNYLMGTTVFKWTIVSNTGGDILASNGLSISTLAIEDVSKKLPGVVVVSSSWSPEAHHSSAANNALRGWSQRGAQIGALDTGGFILAKAGLLENKRATVHYEHIDAFIELFPKVSVTEDLFVIDGTTFTCCGGMASVDLALSILAKLQGEGVANAAARYLFHHDLRGPETSQNPSQLEPVGRTTPIIVRRAIAIMEIHLETTIAIPDICEELQISQRHLNRLFKTYVRKTPVQYYRHIRLDRARGLVTQTEMKFSEIAVASGFNSQIHFSRAYHERFGLPPKRDRIEGRVPFEFRAWPMHSPKGL